MSIKRWSRQGTRAPHKPLLVLLAIGKCLKGIDRLVAFEDVKRELIPLLQEFGPFDPNPRPEYPFWRLRNDGIWEVPDHALVKTTCKGDASAKYMLENRICGGFTKGVFETLKANPEFAFALAQEMVNAHFPETLHEGIFELIGMDKAADLAQIQHNRIWVQKSLRDPRFRERVLAAYGYRCAVCSYSVRVRDNLVGLEAAHIRWHQQNGPAIVKNGIAMCANHHKLFDRGAFTVEPDRTIIVSEFTSGKGQLEWLERYNGASLQAPSEKSNLPAKEYLKWHRSDVFKGPH